MHSFAFFFCEIFQFLSVLLNFAVSSVLSPCDRLALSLALLLAGWCGTRAKHHGSILAIHFVGARKPQSTARISNPVLWRRLLIRHPAFPSLFLRRAPTLTLPTCQVPGQPSLSSPLHTPTSGSPIPCPEPSPAEHPALRAAACSSLLHSC